ncbi:ANM_collapsed_G0054390.mRNA.1.CDS.1 [Saccharomyces cerevisiae]|nr:ANM_collapsed_G0054390.mRNA.1.CDS.1 [Saccharomyces cerevisiae]
MRSDGSDYASTDNYELTAAFTGPSFYYHLTIPYNTLRSYRGKFNARNSSTFKNNATFFNDIYVLEGTCGTDVVSLKNFSP